MNAQATDNQWLPLAPGRPAAPGHGNPRGRDYIVFLLGMPLFFALWATAIGMSPTPTLGFRDGYLYIATQVSAAWWANAFASRAVARFCGPALPRLWLRLAAGFALAWLPLALFYQAHSAFFAGVFPALAGDAVNIEFTAGYLARLLRYSLPFLPLWIAAVYGYQYLFGIAWFESPPATGAPGDAAGAGIPARPAAVPTASPAPPASPALPVALHAQEHYIAVWAADRPTLERRRFSDAVAALPAGCGGQVHRSWWVRWDAVARVRRRGRSLELELSNGLRVPVSLAHKAAVQQRFPSRNGSIPRARWQG